MAILDDVKALKDDSFIPDNVYSIYIRLAESRIATYLNNGSTNADIESKYPDAVIEFALILLNRRGDEGVRVSEISSVQNTYEGDTNGIPSSIVSLLPTPSAILVDTYTNQDYYNNNNFSEGDEW